MDAADQIDCPILLVNGSQNKFWQDSNKLCHEILNVRYPRLEVDYAAISAFGHFDTFIGRGAAYDVFPRITNWTDQRE